MHQDQSGMHYVEGLVLKRKGLCNVELLELDVVRQITGSVRTLRDPLCIARDNVPRRNGVLVDGNDPGLWERFGRLDGPAQSERNTTRETSILPCATPGSEARTQHKGRENASTSLHTLFRELR